MNLVSSEAAETKDARGAALGRVRVLHLNAGNLYGGVETLLATLARLRHLGPGMEPQFGVCFEGRLSRELAESGVPVHDLGPVRISRPWTVWAARRRLREILRRQPIDLVVCHMAWSWVVFGATARAAGCHVALWVHGLQGRRTWLDRLAGQRRPDFAIANSHFTGEALRGMYPSVPAEILYNPVALPDLRESAEWRAGVRNEQGIDEETTVILQAGRLEAWKGHAAHLGALSQLPQSKKWECWIAGGPQTDKESEYLEQLKTMARELRIGARVKFLGQRRDVPQLLAASDIFCQPNEGPEPFGMVFVEALWAGRPVVSSALGGAQEIINASCGVLVPTGDRENLGKALLGLIESPELRKRLGAAGPARARELCDPATQMDRLSRLFRASTRTGGRA